MLSSIEMVCEPSGKTKTLADLIKEGGILTPETPVYTSDDSMELKDYIESLILEPPTPGLGNWELIDTLTNVNKTDPAAYPESLQTLFTDDTITEVFVAFKYLFGEVSNPAGTWACATFPIDVFKKMGAYLNFPNGNSNIDTWTANVYLVNSKDNDTYKYQIVSNSTWTNGFDISFYAR